MAKPRRTPAGAALTDLIMDIFRLNSRLLTSGDRLVTHLGLTSARWQVLGAIVAAVRPQPVSWLARDLGANRQNVQRIVDDLAGMGLVAFEHNPHHRRALLVLLTATGKKVFDDAMALQAPWVNGLAAGLSVKEIETVQRVFASVRERLDQAKGDDGED